MIAVQVIPDRFAMGSQAGSSVVSNARSKFSVRRPTNGIQLKEDTFATLRVVVGNGQNIPLIDAGGRDSALKIGEMQATNIYSNFLIQTVTEERQEKQQIVETFGEAFVFFFGERPRIITVQGILANTFDFNWEAEWWANYDEYIRGTKCVENDARVFLSYDESLVSGYILSASVQKSAEERNFVNFAFQMFVTGYTSLSRLGDSNAKQSSIDPVGPRDPFRDVFRPQLIPRNGLPPSSGSLDLDQLSLVEEIQNGLGKVQKAWSTAQMMARNALSSIDTLAFGSLVRVPVGFAGSLSFDDPKVSTPGLRGDGLIEFTTFADNFDEYVGFSSHYGSSDFWVGETLGPDPYRSLDDGRKMVEEAQLQWRKMGFILPPDNVGRILAVAQSTAERTGLVDIGASRKMLAKVIGDVSETLADTTSVLDVVLPSVGSFDVTQTTVGRSGIVPVVE